MAKVVCESCGTSFLPNVVRELENCPVCGKLLWSQDDEESIELDEELRDTEEGLMYFDAIMIFKDEPEYDHVSLYCGECGKDNSLEINNFEKLVDKEYVILKGIKVTCRGCGKEHKPRKILYKMKDSYAPPLPRCPLCNSVMIKKIKTSSKVLAAATIGVFALPYNSKTFECQDCGYRF